MSYREVREIFYEGAKNGRLSKEDFILHLYRHNGAKYSVEQLRASLAIISFTTNYFCCIVAVLIVKWSYYLIDVV